MRTLLFGDATIATFDDSISPLLSYDGNDEFGGGTPFRIGIRNEAGQIYRAIDLEGLHQLVHISEALKRLGLRDELDMRPARGGFDSIFSR